MRAHLEHFLGVWNCLLRCRSDCDQLGIGHFRLLEALAPGTLASSTERAALAESHPLRRRELGKIQLAIGAWCQQAAQQVVAGRDPLRQDIEIDLPDSQRLRYLPRVEPDWHQPDALDRYLPRDNGVQGVPVELLHRSIEGAGGQLPSLPVHDVEGFGSIEREVMRCPDPCVADREAGPVVQGSARTPPGAHVGVLDKLTEIRADKVLYRHANDVADRSLFSLRKRHAVIIAVEWLEDLTSRPSFLQPRGLGKVFREP